MLRCDPSWCLCLVVPLGDLQPPEVSVNAGRSRPVAPTSRTLSVARSALAVVGVRKNNDIITNTAGGRRLLEVVPTVPTHERRSRRRGERTRCCRCRTLLSPPFRSVSSSTDAAIAGDTAAIGGDAGKVRIVSPPPPHKCDPRKRDSDVLARSRVCNNWGRVVSCRLH